MTWGRGANKLRESPRMSSDSMTFMTATETDQEADLVMEEKKDGVPPNPLQRGAVVLVVVVVVVVAVAVVVAAVVEVLAVGVAVVVVAVGALQFSVTSMEFHSEKHWLAS